MRTTLGKRLKETVVRHCGSKWASLPDSVPYAQQSHTNLNALRGLEPERRDELGLQNSDSGHREKPERDPRTHHPQARRQTAKQGHQSGRDGRERESRADGERHDRMVGRKEAACRRSRKASHGKPQRECADGSTKPSRCFPRPTTHHKTPDNAATFAMPACVKPHPGGVLTQKGRWRGIRRPHIFNIGE